MHRLEAEREKLKLIQLTLLDAVDRISKANQLRYYMIGGTLIGAIRHGGQIPWDDDIDIAMPRGDYEIMKRVINNQHSERIFFQDAFTDSNYPLPFGKIRCEGTAYVDKHSEPYDMHRGIFIDVFPLDDAPYGGNLEFRIRYHIVHWCFNILLRILKRQYYNKFPLKYRLVRGVVIRSLKRLQFFSMSFWVNPNSSRWINYFPRKLRQAEKEMLSKKIFGLGRPMKFECQNFSAPDQAEEYLEAVFGDYMTLPPAAERVGHGPAEIYFGKGSRKDR